MKNAVGKGEDDSFFRLTLPIPSKQSFDFSTWIGTGLDGTAVSKI
jgi:hypothetical protein